MSLLLSPLTLRSTTFRNRLWLSPMCQYSATDGVPDDWHLVHLAQFASGGVGLVLAESTAVSPEGRISPRDTGLWNDAQQVAWARIVAAVHSRGAHVGVQLGHAGRKASTWWPWAPASGSVPAADGGWQTVAPSAVAFDGYAAPAALTAGGIGRIVEDFAAAARRAVDAGFDTVEIHGAHGYLLHQFLSPLSNARTDAWGGDLAGRARLLLDVVRAVRATVGPDMPLLLRVSATDWAPGGLDVDDVATVARWAREAGVDLVDVSSGGLVAHQQITVGPGYQVPFAARVREVADVPTGAVGLITTPTQAEEILASGAADVVLVGREHLRDPHLGLRAERDLGSEQPELWPVQYARARR